MNYTFKSKIQYRFSLFTSIKKEIDNMKNAESLAKVYIYTHKHFKK